jgi:hydroxyacylglutathione hydrolase
MSIVAYERPDARAPDGRASPATPSSSAMSGRPDLLASLGFTRRRTGRAASTTSLHERSSCTLPDATRRLPRARRRVGVRQEPLRRDLSSTIGDQKRRSNYALAPMTEDEFVAAVTEGQSVAPAVLRVRRHDEPP